MFFFLAPWIVLVIGIAVNVLLDRHSLRRTAPRVVEIALLWSVVWLGAWGVLGALGHIGPNSAEVAASIGYAPSMFQWEVGFGDLALSAVAIGSFWMRDRWLTAGVVALAISYWGDAIGHVMQYVGEGNVAPDNTWAIPSDMAQPLLCIVLLVLYRRGLGKLPPRGRRGVQGEVGLIEQELAAK
jgi:hypothetical protein